MSRYTVILDTRITVATSTTVKSREIGLVRAIRSSCSLGVLRLIAQPTWGLSAPAKEGHRRPTMNSVIEW